MMASFDVLAEWVILVQTDAGCIKRAARDLSRCIHRLASLKGTNTTKPPEIADRTKPAPPPEVPVIVLNSDGAAAGQNGFSWKADTGCIEISGESDRGLCNGIYSFLAALGISWPAPGQEKFPPKEVELSRCFPLSCDSVNAPSHNKEAGLASLRRYFVSMENGELKKILKKSEAFAVWAARQRYDAVIIPLKAFSSRTKRRKLKLLKQYTAEYDIGLEAGGYDLSSLAPRRYFFLHRDFFRMNEGRRIKAHHFCPTNPGLIALLEREGKKLFLAAGDVNVLHLWPDRGYEAVWCSCPSCRAFTPHEQNRIAVNAAADILAALNPGAVISYFENTGEAETDADTAGNIPMRKTLFRIKTLPGERGFP